jgi:hypothetical protein
VLDYGTGQGISVVLSGALAEVVRSGKASGMSGYVDKWFYWS